MRNSFQFRVLILLGYLLSLNEFGENLETTIILGRYVSKP